MQQRNFYKRKRKTNEKKNKKNTKIRTIARSKPVALAL